MFLILPVSPKLGDYIYVVGVFKERVIEMPKSTTTFLRRGKFYFQRNSGVISE